MSVESEAVKLEDAPSQPQAETDVAAEQVEQVSKVEPQVEIAAQADAQAEVVVPEEATDPEKNDEDVEPSAKRVKLDPVQLGPKIFKDGQSLMLYHANLLRKMTLNQNFNEVRVGFESIAAFSPSCSSRWVPKQDCCDRVVL